MNLVINFLFVGVLLLFTGQCSKDELTVTSDMPECVEVKITEILQQEVWNPPAKIYRYLYNDEVVYFIPQRCCDIPSQLYDTDCHLICAPDGGFSGNGDGKCADFFSTRQDEKLVWEDER